MKPNSYNPLQIKQILCATAILGTASSAYAADGTWSNTNTADTSTIGWANTTNWSGGIAAGGAGSVADFSQLNLTADNIVILSDSTTVGTIKFGDTTPSNNWSFALPVGAGSSRTLTMDNGLGNAAVFEVSSGTVTMSRIFTFVGSPTIGLNVGTQGFNKTGAGTLLMGANSRFQGSGLVTVEEGGLTFAQAATNNTFTGNYQVNDGATLSVGDGVTGNGSLGTAFGTVNLATGSTLRIQQTGGATPTTVPWDKITGGGTVVVNFAGSGSANRGLTLGNTSGFTGTLVVESGRVANAGSTANTDIIGGVASFAVKSGGQLGLWNGGTYAQSISIEGTGYGEDKYEAALRGANDGKTLNLNGAVTLTGNATVGGRDTGVTNFNNAIGESGGSRRLTVGAANLNGIVVLKADNTYTGGTTVNAGTLTAGHANAFGSGKVTLAGGSLKTGAFTVANDVDITGNAAISGTYSGKVDTGTNALRAINTTGGVSIDELAGQGVFSGGLVTIVGSHTPGNSPGTQTFGSGLAYGNNSSLTLEIAANGLTFDFIDITGGGLTIGTDVALTLNLYGAADYTDSFWDIDQSFTLISTDSKSGDFLTPTNNLGGAGEGSWTYGWQGNDYVANWTATAVPEPTTALLGSIGVLFLLRRRRA